MIDHDNVPDVAPDEILARYILFKSHIRGSNISLKPDAFIPHPREDLSVTRHLAASERELWNVGDDVAAARSRTLYGRGDFLANICLKQGLSIGSAPIIPENPNHADISGWPADKPSQKIIAQEIASDAQYTPRP